MESFGSTVSTTSICEAASSKSGNPMSVGSGFGAYRQTWADVEPDFVARDVLAVDHCVHQAWRS